MERTIASPQTGAEYRVTLRTTWVYLFHAARSYLANLLQKVRAGVWSARTNLSADITPSLDVGHIVERLGVVKRAQEDGRRNSPQPSEETPAGTQREIIAYFAGLHRRARQHADQAVEKANSTLDQIRDSEDLAKLHDIPDRLESKILRYLADFESRLQHCAERERNQKRHYEAFRQENKLERVANYPDVAFLYYLSVPFLIAGMAYALPNLLAPDAGGSSSLSRIWSVPFSAVAIAIPFIGGMVCLRAVNHVSDLKKLSGWIGVVASIAAILAIAFYADFHLAAIQANPDLSNRDIFDSMLASPLDSGVASWKVLGAVALMGLFSMFLGYRADDIYPGYGSVQRSYYRTRNELENISTRLRKRINTFADEAEAEVSGITRAYKAKVRGYMEMIRKVKQIPSLLKDYNVDLEEACNIVLDRYRAANTAARKSEAPMSFTEHVCFNTEDRTPSGWQLGSSDEVEAVRRSVIELENQAKLALQNLRAVNLRMINAVAEPQFNDTGSSA